MGVKEGELYYTQCKGKVSSEQYLSCRVHMYLS
jgi:hypothetical protein